MPDRPSVPSRPHPLRIPAQKCTILPLAALMALLAPAEASPAAPARALQGSSAAVLELTQHPAAARVQAHRAPQPPASAPAPRDLAVPLELTQHPAAARVQAHRAPQSPASAPAPRGHATTVAPGPAGAESASPRSHPPAHRSAAAPNRAADLQTDLAALRDAPHLADGALVSRIAETYEPEALAGLIEVYHAGVAPYVQLLILRVLPRFDGRPALGKDAVELLADAATSHAFEELRDQAFEGLARAPIDGPAFLRLIVDSNADAASRERALRLHIELRSSDTTAMRAWYERIWETGLGIDPATHQLPEAGPDGFVPAPPTPLDSLRPIAFTALVRTLDEGTLRGAVRDRFAAVRRAALEELARRGADELGDLVERMFEDPREQTDNRVWAARRALALRGDKYARELVDVATKKQASPLLRDGIAALLAAADGEPITKLIVKRFGKGKDADKLFDLIAIEGHWDPKLERALLKLVRHKDEHISERAAGLAYRLGLVDAGEVIVREFERGDPGPRRARLLPLVALFETDPAAWRARLVALTASAEVEVRIAALELLAGFGTSELDALIAALDAERSVVRIAAADALAQVAKDSGDRLVHLRVIDAMMARLAEEAGRVELELTEDLFGLTGAHYGPRGQAWIGWWQARGRSEFQVPSAKDLRDAEEAALARRLGSQTTAEFFGIRIRSNRLVFIVDVSGSMEARTGTKYEQKSGMLRIERAQEELAKALAGLGPDSFFNIVKFSERATAWEEALTQCTPEAYEEAVEFNDDLRPGGGTNLVGALDLAFADPEVDTIFVLSDGEPTMGWTTAPDVIRDHVARLNQHRGVVVHAIAIGGGLQILEHLAADSGGAYRAFP